MIVDNECKKCGASVCRGVSVGIDGFCDVCRPKARFYTAPEQGWTWICDRRRHGTREYMAQCSERDLAEEIVSALNANDRTAEPPKVGNAQELLGAYDAALDGLERHLYVGVSWEVARAAIMRFGEAAGQLRQFVLARASHPRNVPVAFSGSPGATTCAECGTWLYANGLALGGVVHRCVPR